MNCSALFAIPQRSTYSMTKVKEFINECLHQNSLVQLLWLKEYLTVDAQDLKRMGVYIDFRIIKQAECLLSSLRNHFPGLKASISGRYAAHPDNIRNPWCDDMGGFFEVKLENGAIRVEDTPIV